MKGQTQPVVLMLTATVLVGSIATVYVWGEPLLTKGQNQAELKNLEKDAVGMRKMIQRVSRNGNGTSGEIKIGQGLSDSGNFKIEINESKDYIDISMNTQNPPYPVGTWTMIKGKNLQNLTIGKGSYALKGQDLPGIVAVRPVGTSDRAKIIYRVEFRNMYVETSPQDRLERVDIVAEGRSTATEPSTVGVRNMGAVWDRGDQKVIISGGKELPRKNIRVQIDLR